MVDLSIALVHWASLKISTIEETAEQAEARGGKGNAPLIVWDYGKEITLNITDALYSPKSMALMHNSNLGNLNVYAANSAAPVTKYKNFKVVSTTDDKANDYVTIDQAKALLTDVSADVSAAFTAIFDKIGINSNEKSSAKLVHVYNPERNVKDGIVPGATGQSEIEIGNTYTLEYQVTPVNKSYIEISADGFPGTYKVVGDTWARGKGETQDQYFQFEIAEAKISAETTITLEAEGDPSVFEMTLRVLRPDNGKMMKLIQYDFNTETVDNSGVTFRKYENGTDSTYNKYPAGDD